MDEPLQVILDFVEGRMSGKDFEQRVYSDPILESFLKPAAIFLRSISAISEPSPAPNAL